MGAGRACGFGAGFFLLIMEGVEWRLNAAGLSAPSSTPEQPATWVSPRATSGPVRAPNTEHRDLFPVVSPVQGTELGVQWMLHKHWPNESPKWMKLCQGGAARGPQKGDLRPSGVRRMRV